MTDYEGPGAVRSEHPMGASHSQQYDHDAHREELWGDVRDDKGDVRPSILTCPRCGKECDGKHGLAAHRSWCGGDSQSQAVSPEERRAVYYQYWTTDYSQHKVAKHFGIGQRTVSNICARDTHLAGQTEDVAKELGYPEERDWPPGKTRKVEV